VFGSVKLKDVLDEYRQAHAPHTRIDLREVDEAVGFLKALALPAVKNGQRTQQEDAYQRAVVPVIRMRRLLAVIEKHERV
jgi:hypothetical protein